MDKVAISADGVVTGFGKVAGRTVCAYARILPPAGHAGRNARQEDLPIMDMAMKMKAPMVGFIDSGGTHPGRINGWTVIPTYSTGNSRPRRDPADIGHHGAAAGGAVYSPAMTDFIFMVKKDQLHVHHRAGRGQSVTSEEIDNGSAGRRDDALH